MRNKSILVLALAAGACGSPASNAVPTSAAAENSYSPPSARSEAQVDASLGGIVAIDNGAAPRATPAPGVPVETAPHPSDLRREAREFPPAFRGKWGIGRADCDLSRVDEAKGLMKIEAGKVTFYESRATVRAMPTRSAYKLVADLDFTGEGQSWQSREQFALATGGIALLRTVPANEGSAGRTIRYERC